ncbi:hypothetical protein Cenrod_1113 [Candidatus Symbiobacter mobilis CR]|uniref:Uncharacterized protein n=1 Tax=Candidatus Symbiobacter mobilis CR TaxID=946483 RepID=U5N6N8_9BURK|nr:hypothetical protein Cenrod_1113 [Candidatus Symbiobacter mobilis CR]
MRDSEQSRVPVSSSQFPQSDVLGTGVCLLAINSPIHHPKHSPLWVLDSEPHAGHEDKATCRNLQARLPRISR